jgi:hypothetical protein
MEVLAYSPLARHSVRIGCSLATPKERAASSLLKGQAKRPLMCASFVTEQETKGDLETEGAAPIVGRVDKNTKPQVNDGVEFGLF